MTKKKPTKLEAVATLAAVLDGPNVKDHVTTAHLRDLEAVADAIDDGTYTMTVDVIHALVAGATLQAATAAPAQPSDGIKHAAEPSIQVWLVIAILAKRVLDGDTQT